MTAPLLWQDWVFAIGQGLFAVALVPSLESNKKPPVFTCGLTGLTLVAFAFCFLTLHLWWACGTTALTACIWLWLGIQQLESRAIR